jgi:alpha-galactosidase
MKKLLIITLSFSLSSFFHLVTLASDNPLKVFILCGQSNMEGHAKISTFEAMKLDPVTKPIYKEMVDASGNPVTCDHVWISYFTGGRDNMGRGIW